MAEEAEKKKTPLEKARAEAAKMLDEIAADVKHDSLRVADRLLSWLWNKLYQGINVENSERVRKLALEGHEIVYVPCHRSHMDYLLLSYLLYHQGLVPQQELTSIFSLLVRFSAAGERFLFAAHLKVTAYIPLFSANI